MENRTALIEWPGNDYITSSLRRAFAAVLPGWSLCESAKELEGRNADLQFSDYDLLDWDAGMKSGNLVSSYVIRKALIRKNHLSHTISLYLAKNPTSVLSTSTPKSHIFALSFPDELDELLLDDLYEINESFEQNEQKEPGEREWFILKPALGDRGNGIRLFSTREELEGIFEEFQVDSENEEDDEVAEKTMVNASQMREWVIQEYLSKPLLLDPIPSQNSIPRKFHLRVYVLAVGALQVYVHHPFLALFAPSAYEFPPSENEDGSINIAPHLTNTCLQSSSDSSIGVTTLSALSDHLILAGPHKGSKLSVHQIASIEESVGKVVAETFRAGVGSGSGFQCLPNIFEIFGVDFLVDEKFQVSLLEINACPDFAQTGKELQNIIDDLFISTLKTAVVPFFTATSDIADTLATTSLAKEGGLRKVLEMEISKAW